MKQSWHSHDSKCQEITRSTPTISYSIARLDGASIPQLIIPCLFLEVALVSNEIKLSPASMLQSRQVKSDSFWY